MHNILNEIMKKISPAWGICDYAVLENHLLPCGGKIKIPHGAASVIVALFPYYLGEGATINANVSRYAVVPDYHEVVMHRLNTVIEQLKKKVPAESFIAFTDNSPIPEVKAAATAGLGVIGENNLLINPDFGSWVFIGEIVTTLKIEPPKSTGLHRCTACGKCVAACPASILGKLEFDRAKCLSHITQSKGELTPEQAKLIKSGGSAWGCDICQLVCPMNNSAKVTPIEEFIDNIRPKAKIGADISDRAYAWRGREVVERNLNILQGQ